MKKTFVDEFIKQENFVASKKLGQNFLINEGIQNRIVESANLEPNDFVIEIGPGLGAISNIILKTNNMLAIELDKRLHQYLKDKYQDNDRFNIINNDFLKVDLKSVLKEFKTKYNYNRVVVIANLPYSISSLIVAKLCLDNVVDECIIMVQKEMAQRICAKANTSHYNSFSAWLHQFVDVKFLFDVGPKNFNPAPKVMSTVIRLEFKPQQHEFDHKEYREFLNRCFMAKRKTLYNNLISYYPKDKIFTIFNDFDITKKVRAQEIEPNELFNLFTQFKKKV